MGIPMIELTRGLNKTQKDAKKRLSKKGHVPQRAHFALTGMP
jgi:hypothetical protein